MIDLPNPSPVDLLLLEDRLRESEARYRQLSDRLTLATRAAAIGIWDADLLNDTVVWDATMLRLYGLDLSQFQGSYQGWLAALHPEDRDGTHHAIEQALSGEKEFDTEFRVLWPDGTVRHLKANGLVQRDPCGRPVRMLGTNWDITERKRLENEIRLRERQLSSFFTGASAGLVLLDRDLRYLQINDTLAAMNGLTVREHLGRTVREVVPGLAPVLEPVLRQVLSSGKPVLNHELRGKVSGTAATQRSWVASYFPIAGPDARPEGVGAIIVETTEQKLLEAQLRQAQKMEGIGQLAGGVAHDFNNMLSAVLLNVQVLLMDPSALAPEMRDGLNQIVLAVERAANLSRQLLTFSRKQVMRPEPLLLNEVVANLVKMLRRAIGEAIDLQCQYPAELPLVQADLGMMEQVVVNLVVNARDAMPHGGKLSLATERVELDPLRAAANPEARPGKFVCLVVSDTGTGIAPEHLPRIFEPFFTTKEPGQGTGLGLATLYGIVKQHHGWVEVTSRLGEGTTFRVYLPALAQGDLPARTAAAKAEPRGGLETILLVEDEVSVRMITRRVLEKYGYTVLEATGGNEALALWKQQSQTISLLLTDIVLPEAITGRDLAHQLRTERAGLKVIFMSGYSGEALGRDTQFFHRHKDYFLQKPCTSSKLLETVRQCLDEPTAVKHSLNSGTQKAAHPGE